MDETFDSEVIYSDVIVSQSPSLHAQIPVRSLIATGDVDDWSTIVMAASSYPYCASTLRMFHEGT